jgi:Cu/Ag efflux protein CusF
VGPTLLEGVEVGDEVDFRVRYADGKYTVTDVDPR